MRAEQRCFWGCFACVLAIGSVGTALGAGEIVQVAQAVEAAAAVDAAAPAPAEAEDDADADAVDEDAPVKLRFMPQSVSFSRNASFNEQGEVTNENSYLNLSMRVHYTSDRQLTAYELLSVEPMETTHGQVLTPNIHTHRSNIHRHRHGNQSPQFHMSISVQNPGAATGSIMRVAGKMRVHYAGQGKQRVRLGPYENVVGKRALIQGLPEGDGWVRVKQEDERVRLEMPPDLMGRVAAFRFLRKDGTEIQSNSWGSGTSSNMHYRSFRLSMPDNGRIELDLWDRLQSSVVAFELKDFPLPGEQGPEAFDLTVRAVPADEAAPVDAVADGEDAGVQVLDVQVEE